jgi:hypothetical protein
MNDQTTILLAATAIEQKIFTTPAHRYHFLPCKALVQIRRDGQAEAWRTHNGAKQKLIFDRWQQATATNFNFGQLGHRLFL